MYWKYSKIYRMKSSVGAVCVRCYYSSVERLAVVLTDDVVQVSQGHCPCQTMLLQQLLLLMVADHYLLSYVVQTLLASELSLHTQLPAHMRKRQALFEETKTL